MSPRDVDPDFRKVLCCHALCSRVLGDSPFRRGLTPLKQHLFVTSSHWYGKNWGLANIDMRVVNISSGDQGAVENKMMEPGPL